MKSLHTNASLLEDLILSEKNTAFSNIGNQLILLSTLHGDYVRGRCDEGELRKCYKDLSDEIWESMFLEQSCVRSMRM